MNKSKNTTNPYQTLLVLCVALMLFYFWTKWQWFLGIAILIGLTGILCPYLTKQIDFLWMKLAYFLGLFIPNILLSFVYFLVLLPLAFLSKKISRKDTLQLKKPQKSTFKSQVKKFEAASFENPW